VTVRSAGGLILVALVLAAMPEPAAAQCAMCRRALASPEAQQLAEALRSGILFLLAAPFLVFGIVAVLAVRQRRRTERESAWEHPAAGSGTLSG
jgi:hypothetical protein